MRGTKEPANKGLILGGVWGGGETLASFFPSQMGTVLEIALTFETSLEFSRLLHWVLIVELTGESK